jgi:hypothetical protein
MPVIMINIVRITAMVCNNITWIMPLTSLRRVPEV